MTVELSGNIGVNDLKVKIDKMRQKIFSQKLNKVVLRISTRVSRIHSANSLLINFKKLTESDISSSGEKKILKVDPADSENSEELTNVEEMEEMLRTGGEGDEPAGKHHDPKDFLIFVQQAFSIIQKTDKTDKKVVEIDYYYNLSDEKLTQLIEEKFSSLTEVTKIKTDHDHIDMFTSRDLLEDQAIAFNPQVNDRIRDLSVEYQEYFLNKFLHGSAKDYKKSKLSNEKTDLKRSKLNFNKKEGLIKISAPLETEAGLKDILEVTQKPPEELYNRRNKIRVSLGSK